MNVIAQQAGESESSRLAIIATGLAFIFGVWILTGNLGEKPFGADELIQQATSEAIAEGRGPVLPSGAEYKRGYDVSVLAGIARKFIDDPETAGRAPAAAFGIINLCLIGFLGWTFGGLWGSFWAVLILAIFPQAIIESRRFRFYSEHMTLMLVALHSVWQLVRYAGEDLTGKNSLARGWMWTLITLIAFAIGIRVQPATFVLIASSATIVLLAGIMDLRRQGWAGLKISVPMQLSSVGVVIGLFLILFFGKLILFLWAAATDVPYWAIHDPGDPRDYYWRLAEQFPSLMTLYPVALVAIALRNWRLAVFLGIWFTIPFLLFSLVLPLKNMRFILGATPALILTGALAAAMGAVAIRKGLESLGASLGYPTNISRGLAIGGVTAIALFVIVTVPAFNNSRKVPITSTLSLTNLHAFENWQQLGKEIRELDKSAAYPIGTVDGLAALFYVGRADFVIQRDDLFESARWAARRANLPRPETSSFDEEKAQGGADFYSGLPVLTQVDSIHEAFAGYPAVLIIADEERWASKTQLNKELKSMLLSDGREICQGNCGTLRLYKLPLQH